MAVNRRQSMAGIGAVLAGMGSASWGQAFPSKPVKVIVPRAPGGGSDIIARLITPGAQQKAGQPFVVENRPDASAVVGCSEVARSAPDGYTLFLADNAFYQNPAVLKKLPYDTLKDFTAVTMLAEAPIFLVLHPDVPATDIKSLVQYAKANPGKLTYASGGIGSSTHLVGVQFDNAAGVQTTHVAYKSAGPALTALLGGHVSMLFGSTAARPHIESGRLRAVAITGKQRDPAMPNVPTFTEVGLKAVDMTSIWGVHAPAGTPLAVRRTLRDYFVDVMRAPDMTKRMAEQGFTVVGSTPEEHEAETRRLVTYWLDMGTKVKLSPD